MGGKTGKAEHSEVGLFPITFTDAAKSVGIELGQLNTFHWHNDMPNLTDDMVLFAKSEGCSNQMFGLRDNGLVLGLQFHAEFNQNNLHSMCENCTLDTQMQGI
eukprot:CAMPEP_0116899764 /NCGR_PEP_ID=MMETSP0467-20121206/8264_1 /TAXON_ID=283647 /ORGANISM="Mesodinium pulex, Strain SPMC105" /LENGTH=102 /DNA_ID=CAMNT_0004572773 /DNA_START=187 /DNA_END=495 /DNA_ORIENTATION=+